MNQPTGNEVLAYIAGFYDGEGSFAMLSPGTHCIRPKPVISLGNTDVGVLMYIREVFSYYDVNLKLLSAHQKKNMGWKPAYRIMTSNRDQVVKIIVLLLPFLIVKLPQAKLLLEYIQLRDVEGLRGRMHLTRELEILELVRGMNSGRGKSYYKRSC